MGELFHALSLRVQSSGERVMLTLAGYIVVLLLLSFAFAAFAYAGATALTAEFGPVAAALMIGGASVILALIVIGWLAYRRRKLKRELRMRRAAQPAVAGAVASALPIMMRTSPLGTLLVVAAGAYVLQRSSQKRQQYRQ